MHHGLQHDQAALAALRVLHDAPVPVRALDPTTFAALHLQHTLAHPPDHVLFPFLHGLEGDNHAQNTFFASSNFAAASGSGGARATQHTPHQHHAHSKRITPRVPQYRGLVWVVCEEDLERAGDTVTLRVLRRRPLEEGGEGGPVPSSDSDEDELEDDSTSDAESYQDDLALDEDEQDMMMLVNQPDSLSLSASTSTSPASPASPPLHLLQTPLPPPHPDNITIASEDAYIHSPSSPSTLSDLGLGITLPEDMGLVAGGVSKKGFVAEGTDKDASSYEGTHMHPVARRSTATTEESLSIPSTSSSASSSSFAVDQAPPPISGSLGLSLAVDAQPSTSGDSQATTTVASEPQSSSSQPEYPKLKRSTDPNAPPLLCSTFRPKELIRRKRTVAADGTPGKKTATGKDGVKDEDWEFVPARVPDGISLRNFGIQVPIYATLSDIVIYSPYGATPAAIALARRFRAAIHAKRLERMRAAGHLPETNAMLYEDAVAAAGKINADLSHSKEGSASERNPSTSATEGDDEDGGFLHYNVFVLDATEDELRAAVPHLMMRSCGSGVPGGLLPAAGPIAAKKPNMPLLEGGAHTDGPDGHLLELGRIEREEMRKSEDMAMDVDIDGDGEGMDVDSEGPKGKLKEEKKEKEEDDLHLIPNTVDFALREREEMRDLTKASEIISLHPDPSPLPVGPISSSLLSGSSINGASTPSTGSSIGKPSVRRVKSDALSDATPAWDPRVGQVYLGNSGDVPLVPDVPSQFRHAATLGHAAEEAARWDWTTLTKHLCGVEGLKEEYEADFFDGPADADEDQEDAQDGRAQPHEDDPFNYSATNDPALGFGYDICVECHDLAPFPSTAHLRAAEEHLATLDVMWRERWERAWYAQQERKASRQEERESAALRPNGSALDTESSDEGEGGDRGRERRRMTRSAAPGPPPPAPPRPPPHANAVIHLPFPSSPSNTQATMVSLMPIVRFLEKWVRPIPVPLPPPKSGLVIDTSSRRSPTPPELKNLQMIGTVDPMKNAAGAAAASSNTGSRRWSSVTALMPTFPSFPGASAKEQSPPPPPAIPLPAHPPSRSRAMTSPSSQPHLAHPPTPVQARTRPLKILLYSSDGYTESSVPALCLLMAIKGLMLPEAYLELQVAKRRSFFVYQGDLGILRRVEGRLKEEREREREKERDRERERERVAAGAYLSSLSTATINANGKRTAPTPVPTRGSYWMGSSNSSGTTASFSSSATPTPRPIPNRESSSTFIGRPAAKSVSFAHAPQIMSPSPQSPPTSSQPQLQIAIPSPAPVVESQNITVSATANPTTTYGGQTHFEFGSLPAQNPPHRPAFSTSASVQHPLPPPIPQQQQQPSTAVVKGRPRASTSPWLPSLFGGDHQSWFNDPRFDGSFPSRVLPFLYLGNLNHASNVYMLHALGITHVVSVGECALVPPPHHINGATAASCHRPGPGAHFVPGKGPGGQGSLWIEEREGRIKVLDIKGVCDDGIDTLEPQLEPICDWIDKARQEGGQVLVHCRVGVSRSATVTIAYVMKHLDLPLVDAYLIVRSRRLSVLIQPNMRLLYNLCGWEIKLAKERANGDERKLKKELCRTLTWPYLSKEVHALNEKYLH
ncbi:hypothetical protein BDN70DRAFT_908748 [Pholiota conissans]|uniref:Protein-tyrosine-phosphatase n=1 Tax=Pholiota conissans TaxID=109636 RepID=A0A9P6CUC9_9AGAR|nr:hypothetical protein BDN70DRAFT_908748 [Pholiota conissans]